MLSFSIVTPPILDLRRGAHIGRMVRPGRPTALGRRTVRLQHKSRRAEGEDGTAAFGEGSPSADAGERGGAVLGTGPGDLGEGSQWV